MASALEDADAPSMWSAVGVMTLMIIGVNLLLWQPCLAWAERFRFEDGSNDERTSSRIYDLLRRWGAQARFVKHPQPANASIVAEVVNYGGARTSALVNT